jgi:hypothetical protein
MRGGHLPGREQQPQALACLKPALEPEHGQVLVAGRPVVV